MTATVDLVALDDKALRAPALELRDVRAAYGRIEVVHGVSLVVPTGSPRARRHGRSR